jgi:hypothetical protein
MAFEFETKETVINSRRYLVTVLPYKTGRKVLVRLLKLLGPAVEVATTGAAGVLEMEAKAAASLLGGALASFLQNLEEADLDFLIATFGPKTRVSIGGAEPVWLTEENQMVLYSGNYLELFQWLGFALKVNYLGFTEGPAWQAAKAKVEALLAMAKERSASQSPRTSTGRPTGSPPQSATPSA